MKKYLFFVISFLFVVLLLIGIGTANPRPDTNVSSNESLKNMTYGQCVSDAAEIKNSCFTNTKERRVSCVDSAYGNTDEFKKCNSDYKTELSQCKFDFKAAKKDCIQKTKPSLWARMRYGFA